MNKKKIIIIVSVFVAAAVVVAAIIIHNNRKSTASVNSENNTSVSENADATQQKDEKAVPSDNASEPDTDKKEDNKSSGTEKKEDEKVYTPTFMYFVSKSDADFDKTNAMIDELKKEYEGEITFDVRNIDEDTESAKNFPVSGQTPALIMLNVKNDISAFEFKCNDKEKLKQDIENAMNAN